MLKHIICAIGVIYGYISAARPIAAAQPAWYTTTNGVEAEEYLSAQPQRAGESASPAAVAAGKGAVEPN